MSILHGWNKDHFGRLQDNLDVLSDSHAFRPDHKLGDVGVGVDYVGKVIRE